MAEPAGASRSPRSTRGPMSAEAFLDQVATGLGPDVLDHRAGPVVGRATADVGREFRGGRRRRRGLLGGAWVRCGDPHRVRRPGRLAVGARDLARARPGLTCARGRAMLSAMYVPAHFRPDDDEVRELLRNLGAADLITATADGLLATMLPLSLDEPAAGGIGRLGRAATATSRATTANGRCRRSARRWPSSAGPNAYISPAWYATKREHGRVVPTWNYITAHVHGRLVIHDDPAWVEANVRRAERPARGVARARRGRWTTPPCPTSRASSRRSSASSSSSTGSRASGSSARTARTRTSRARSMVSRRPARRRSRPRCGRWDAATG